MVDAKCVMYHGINSKPDHPPPPGKPPGNFLKERIPQPPGTKEVRNPNLWGRKIVLKPHLQGNYFQKSSKKNLQNMRQKL